MAREIAVDRLAQAGASLEVVFLDGESYGSDTERGQRRPHRHDYHELVWTRRGTGRHLIDGEVSYVRPGRITLIRRRQIHVFESARDLHGAIVRFGDELLQGDSAAGVTPIWLARSRGEPTVIVPPAAIPDLDAVIGVLAAEAAGRPDSRSIEVQRHLLSTLLLWVERWHEASRTDRRETDDPALQLYRRFTATLESDYARHHDAAHYAEVLRTPQAVLSRALSDVTGRTTKELITDRRMLEAARLLRFSDMSVGEIAFRAGYDDQLYFSRAFKRQHGEPPSAYRERVRGRDPAR
jgi:AraC family transcriptional activator of pobA